MIAFGLGGNQERSEEALKQTTHELKAALKEPKSSDIYITKPLGDSVNSFVNSVVVGSSPHESLDQWWQFCTQIETKWGRQRHQEDIWQERILDIDILLWDEHIICTSNLVIPHPQLHRRLFVLAPLVQVCPDWVHPILKMTIDEFWCSLQSQIDSDFPGSILDIKKIKVS